MTKTSTVESFDVRQWVADLFAIRGWCEIVDGTPATDGERTIALHCRLPSDRSFEEWEKANQLDKQLRDHDAQAKAIGYVMITADMREGVEAGLLPEEDLMAWERGYRS